MYSVHVLNGVAGGPLAYAAVHGGHAEPGEVNPHHLTEKKIFFTVDTSKVVADSWGQNFSNSLPCLLFCIRTTKLCHLITKYFRSEQFLKLTFSR